MRLRKSIGHGGKLSEKEKKNKRSENPGRKVIS
jgi:hypothetical protein